MPEILESIISEILELWVLSSFSKRWKFDRDSTNAIENW